MLGFPRGRSKKDFVSNVALFLGAWGGRNGDRKAAWLWFGRAYRIYNPRIAWVGW
jgi:hypothetical protein